VKILGGFDEDLRDHLQETMIAKGIKVICHQVLDRSTKASDGRLKATFRAERRWSPIRSCWRSGAFRTRTGSASNTPAWRPIMRGAIVVDNYSRTSVDNIWAVGDVTNRVQLTPVAIHEAMCFLETAFKDNPTEAGLRDDRDRGLLAAGNRHGRADRAAGRCEKI
jgi:glutathione reductase (NADPH)